MSHDGPDTHPHGHQDDRKDTKACCGQTAEDTAQVAAPPPSSGRSFRVNGLDCAEEVAILNKVVGPEVGGSEHLAFDVFCLCHLYLNVDSPNTFYPCFLGMLGQTGDRVGGRQ